MSPRACAPPAFTRHMHARTHTPHWLCSLCRAKGNNFQKSPFPCKWGGGKRAAPQEETILTTEKPACPPSSRSAFCLLPPPPLVCVLSLGGPLQLLC